MADLPVLRPREVVRALERAGFVRERQRGSHLFLVHNSRTRATVVPIHNRDVRPSLLRKILKDAELTPEEFIELLQ